MVTWDKKAFDALESHCNRIKKDSFLAAEMVRRAIFEETERLKPNPEIYPLDRFRRNNDGMVRAFEKLSLRVSYEIKPDRIRILRVRHVRQKPLDY